MTRSILYIADILEWAKAFHETHGRWPNRHDGPVAGQLDETWSRINMALQQGGRGLNRGNSLPKLFLEHFGRRHKGLLPGYRIEQILAWADAHRKGTGNWPIRTDGPIPGAPQGETWYAVNTALVLGQRGLPGGSSLAQLLSERRGARNHLRLPEVTVEQILAWIDAYRARIGDWPTKISGPVEPKSEVTWSHIDAALRNGQRGLAGNDSLARLLHKQRGVRNPKQAPKLSVRKILSWADMHFKRTGRWPTHLSGPIPEAPGESWSGIHTALYNGLRGSPGGDSLYRLLQRHGRRRGRIQKRRTSLAREAGGGP